MIEMLEPSIIVWSQHGSKGRIPHGTLGPAAESIGKVGVGNRVLKDRLGHYARAEAPAAFFVSRPLAAPAPPFYTLTCFALLAPRSPIRQPRRMGCGSSGISAWRRPARGSGVWRCAR